MNVRSLVTGSLFTAALVATSAFGATASLTAHVNRVMLHTDGAFGGCMAQLSINPKNALNACGAGWVTFSCTGDFADQVAAYRAMDQAQLALATNKKVLVFIDDSRRHNGFCFAPRIDVIR